MANHSATKKSIRKTETRTARNKSHLSALRTQIRKTRETIEAGDKNASQTALRDMEAAYMRAAQKGLVHKNTAARSVSRFSHKVKAL